MKPQLPRKEKSCGISQLIYILDESVRYTRKVHWWQTRPNMWLSEAKTSSWIVNRESCPPDQMGTH